MAVISPKERRKDDGNPLNRIDKSNTLTKQVIVFTLCGVTAIFAMTVCALALKQLSVPQELDRLITYLAGVLSGMLVKTATDPAVNATGLPAQDVKIKQDGDPVPVKDVEGDGLGVSNSFNKDDSKPSDSNDSKEILHS